MELCLYSYFLYNIGANKKKKKKTWENKSSYRDGVLFLLGSWMNEVDLAKFGTKIRHIGSPRMHIK